MEWLAARQVAGFKDELGWKETETMFNHIYDAVRVSELESRSALPAAPRVEREVRAEGGVRFSARIALSSALHRLADALDPKRELLEPRFSPDPCQGC